MEAFVQPAGPDQPDAGRDEPQRVAEGEGRDSERNQETEADVDFEGDERDDDGQEGLDEGREWVAWDSGEEQADEERAENENTHLGQLVGEVKVAGLQALPAEACKAIARQFLESATSAQSNVREIRLLFSPCLLEYRFAPLLGAGRITIRAKRGADAPPVKLGFAPSKAPSK